MNQLKINLAIIQPANFVHSLGFLDQARYVRYQLRKLGAEVSISKNRLREDSINIIFGAHLGLPEDWLARHKYIIFNLEQLGDGGANVSPQYLQLLAKSFVMDYDERNLNAYARNASNVFIVSFQYAPYLRDPNPVPLQERPFDVLFFGTMNTRRENLIRRIEHCGVNVSFFDRPTYSEERDQFIRNAKAVFNCHFYEASRFEQARAFHTLSLGTPFISERLHNTMAPAHFDQSISWVNDENLEYFFSEVFRSDAWYEEAGQHLSRFTQFDATENWVPFFTFCQGYFSADSNIPAWEPTRINLGSGKDYKPGWLNIDILERANPDIVLDLGQPVQFPVTVSGITCREVVIHKESVDIVYANNVLEHVPDLPCLATNILDMLKVGGTFEIEVPYEKSLTAWQDPTHLRAMNENSWIYYADWFWYLGWFEYRFEILRFDWLDMNLNTCAQDQAGFMRVHLRKIETTYAERTVARVMQSNFGGVPDDIVSDSF